MNYAFLLLVLNLNCYLFSAYEPFSLSAALTLTSAFAYYSRDKILNFIGLETCNNYWIAFNNLSGLDHALHTKIYGQRISIDLISKAIRLHVNNEQAKKPLVISLHGWTGCGKTYTGEIIAESFYKMGIDSKYVHRWIGSLHFAHPEKTPLYIDQIRNWIKGNVSRCPYQLFIIDEMDFLSSDLINGIKPYLDYQSNIDGIDFRKAIFIFLSNSGGGDITKLTMEYWDAGKKREYLTMKDFEIISQKAFNEKGGLWHSTLIDKYLIDYYIPYLPLERSHVKLCAQDYLNNKLSRIKDKIQKLGNHGYAPQIEALKLGEPLYIPTQNEQKQLVEDTLKELTYYPVNRALYSTSGCKRIPSKIDMLFYELADAKQHLIKYKDENHLKHEEF